MSMKRYVHATTWRCQEYLHVTLCARYVHKPYGIETDSDSDTYVPELAHLLMEMWRYIFGVSISYEYLYRGFANIYPFYVLKQ